MPCNHHPGHWSWVAEGLPCLSVVAKFFRHNYIYVDVLRHTVVVPRGVVERGSAMGPHPDRRMRLLVRLGLGERLVDTPVRSLISYAFFGPRFDNDLHGLDAHIPPLRKRQLPAHKLVSMNPVADPELQPASGQLINHSCVLSQADWVVHRQLIHHRPKSEDRGLASQRGKVDVRSRNIGEGCILVLDEKVVVVSHRLRCAGIPDVGFIDISGKPFHLRLREAVEYTEFEFRHMSSSPLASGTQTRKLSHNNMRPELHEQPFSPLSFHFCPG